MPHRTALDEPRARNRAGIAALAFVLFTLVALVVVPALVQVRVSALRAEIVASEPARTLVTRLRLNLVRAMLIRSELVIGGSDTASEAFTQVRREERRMFAELAPLASALGPQVEQRLLEFQRMVEEWHIRVAGEEVARRGTEGIGLMDDPGERLAFERVVAAADAVDTAILDSVGRMRAQISAAERAGLWLTLLLGILAVFASAAAAVLWSRLQHFAAEAEHGRRESERQWEAAERQRRELENALGEAARANEARARLLRGVTHDLKNPLGAAMGYAELLGMGIKAPVLPEQEPLIRGIQRSIDGALAIIGDLLDLAQSESGGLAIRPIEVDVSQVAKDTVEDHRAAAEATGHTLEFEAAAEPLPVCTDPDRVRQVLGNLLSNAVKYTPPPGRITVRTELSGGDDAPGDGSWVCVRVADTGPGIPDDQRGAIFEEFTRLDDGSDAGGHGLGLAIARGIARLLGGDLTLEPSGRRGATFVLWLPAPDRPEVTQTAKVTGAAERFATR